MGKELSHQVSTQVVKEMDYLFRLQEEREETHYKNLDAQLRATQQKAQKNFFKKKEKKPKEKKAPRIKEEKQSGSRRPWFFGTHHQQQPD